MTREEIDEIKRHFDTVMARLESKIFLLAEAVRATSRKLDRMEGKLRIRAQAHSRESGMHPTLTLKDQS